MSLIKNTLWNLSGYIIPSLIAIPALGFLARSLGSERFGLFTLAIAIVGYAGIFDAGLTRAIIREVAIFKYDTNEKNKIIATSTLALIVLGCLGGVTIYFSSSFLAGLLNVKPENIKETVQSLSLIAISLPFFLINQAWLAILEGQELFKKINIIKTFSSSFIAGLPALFVLLGNDLIHAVSGLVIARFFSLIITFIFCRNEISSAGLSYHKTTFFRLLKYGGWVTISNIISPLMAYFDRFIVSHIMGASHVAYYTAPAEGVQRLSIFPGALSRAIFPRLSGLQGKEDKKKQRKLAYLLMSLTCGSVALSGCYFATEIMGLWMGKEFALHSSDILKILLIGFMINSIAQIPFADIQAAGYSKSTAIIHLCELLPYFGILYLFIGKWGILGAACAWTLRVTIDCIILLVVNAKIRRS